MAKIKKWFKKVRGSYLPISWQGWLCYIPYSIYLLSVLIFVLRRRDSFWLALFTLIPNWTAAVITMSWIARRKS